MNFFIAFIQSTTSSENFWCSWSCQVSPTAAKRAYHAALARIFANISRRAAFHSEDEFRLRERMGERVEGDPTTVIGLPVPIVLAMLRDAGFNG